MTDIKILKTALDLGACMNATASDSDGGVVVFVGNVRNKTKGRQVTQLEFETYSTMALREMEKISMSAFEQWPIGNLLIHHREGTVKVGEAAVIIIATSPGRDAAFQACRYAIDTLKTTVPIWKKEIFEDGEEWVSAHP